MRLAILAFTCGVFWLQRQAELPDFAAGRNLLLVAAGALLLSKLHVRLRRVALVSACLAGFVWAAFMAHLRLADPLPLTSEGRDIAVVGVVSGLPQRFENGQRFEFAVEESALPVPRQISLAWYRAYRESDDDMAPLREVHAGERWKFTVRLKRPHGNLNPNGFDYEAWLLERGMRATGYVRPAAAPVRLDAFVWRFDTLVERLREAVRGRIQRVLGEDAPYAGILVALTVGDQRAMDAALWQVFARTGTTHLMSISGLHVTMLAGLAAWLAAALWRRSAKLPLRLPVQKVAALAGFAAAFAYALLAGFEVPAQRTVYMLGVVALALWSGRNFAASRVLAAALFVVLLLDPWAVLAAGFWLSFGAVALLFYIGGGRSEKRSGKRHWLSEWGRTQWAVTLGSAPALLALFQQFSLVSPLANAVAIPVVSFIVTPLALAGSVPPFDLLLHGAHLVSTWLMVLLEWLSASSLAIWQQHAPPAWSLPVACCGMLWLFLPRGFPARWLGLVSCLPLVLIAPPRPPQDSATVTVLDVGQGLALHVQTAHHDLIYDTGPAFSPDANSGNRIILPYLRAQGVQALDALIVTHADKDHSGGAQAILDNLPVRLLLDSLPAERLFAAADTPRRDCADGESWNWDGARFELLHPPASHYAERPKKTNDMSCVLKVSAAGHSMLLTADIEALSEKVLLEAHRTALAADVLSVPHHGSRTSSTAEFIAAVGAQTAIFPVGYRNRFGHPKDEVLARYQDSGAAIRRTDSDGALTVHLAKDGITIQSDRATQKRYWHDQ